MAVYCRRCGFKDIPEGTEKCPSCGATIPKRITPNPAKKKQFTPKSNPNVIPPGADKSKAPWIIAIAVILVLGLGAGYFLGNRSGKQSAAVETNEETALSETYDPSQDVGDDRGVDPSEAVKEDSEQEDQQNEDIKTDETAQEKETPEPEPKETAPAVRTGTVYVASNASTNRIKIRKSPGLNGVDTKNRLYNGDRVTVYEETKKDGYTWYRIGENQWMADNGKSFGVKFD